MATPRRPFYSKFVWKDWLAKTQDLDNHEYAAYHRLLTYAATSSPDLCSIPSDDKRLARITRAGMKRWLSVRDRVLGFWEPHVDPFGVQKFVHNRLRWDAGEWFQHVEKQRRAACIRHSIGIPNSESEVRSKKRIKRNTPLPPSPRAARRVVEADGFAEWYEAYPLHKARKAAERAYRAALRETTGEVLLAGARSYASEVAGRERDKIKHPATWLNSGCWGDEGAVFSLVGGGDDMQRRIQARLKELEGS